MVHKDETLFRSRLDVSNDPRLPVETRLLQSAPSPPTEVAMTGHLPKERKMFSFSTIDKMMDRPVVAALAEMRAPAPSLEVTTIEPSQVVAHRDATFQVQVRNNGDATASNVLLSVAANPRAAIVGGNPPPIIQESGQADFLLGDLGPAASIVVDLVVKPQGTQSLALECRTTSQVIDRTEVPVDAAGFQLDVLGPENATINEVFYQYVQVRNDSDLPLKNLTIQQICAPGAGANDQSITLPELPAGQSRTLQFSVKFPSTGALEVRYVAQNELVQETVRDIVNIVR
jgi:hypothetical protein